ncbi:unnamed protein product [Effrenium voratum]|nr:unnamed protein product [Effrenium voratum]
MPLDLASVSAQLELNDIPESAHEPGPGHYFGPDSQGFNAMGKQMFSKCRSAPEVSLPKTGWDNWQKVTVSKAAEATGRGRESPSCAYTVPTTLDVASRKDDGSFHGFGSSNRPDLSLSLGVDPHGSPGPVYNVRDAPIAQISQGRVPKSRDNKSFGCSERFRPDRGGSIGPGQYRRKDFSLRLDNGRSIGTGRQAWEKVVTPGWECEGRCRASPGVGPPMWSEVVRGGVSIGKADRFPKAADGTCSPGPIYHLQAGGVRGGGSPAPRKKPPPKKDATELKEDKLKEPPPPPPPTCGKPPKKPRFRMHLVHSLSGAKHGMWGYF